MKGVTVAILDTGIDLAHPYVRDRLVDGIDVVDPGGDASARPNPTVPGRFERHGTEMAGIVAGSDGPGGLHGVAPGASILPVRVAGWQPDASGDVAVYGRTDQVVAGLEAAVDPDDPLLAEYPEAQLVVRVTARAVYPNCPRYVHRYELVRRSRFVPQPGCPTPVPEWKRSEWAFDALPEHDPARDPGDREVLGR